MNDDMQAATERVIFEAFLHCDGAPPVDTATIETRRPPEPDILCNVSGMGPTAFELVEIVEEDWAQLVSNQIRLEKSLYLAHEQTGEPLSDAYADALIYLRCLPKVPIKQRERVIPALFDFLMMLEPGVKGDISIGDSSDLAGIVRSVHVSRGDFGPGPFFQVEAVKAISDPTAPSIRAKWHRHYQTPYAIELLAYYDWHPTTPEVMWIGEVRRFIEANWATSPFRRVWICDIATKQILFSASAT